MAGSQLSLRARLLDLPKITDTHSGLMAICRKIDASITYCEKNRARNEFARCDSREFTFNSVRLAFLRFLSSLLLLRSHGVSSLCHSSFTFLDFASKRGSVESERRLHFRLAANKVRAERRAVGETRYRIFSLRNATLRDEFMASVYARDVINI